MGTQTKWQQDVGWRMLDLGEALAQRLERHVDGRSAARAIRAPLDTATVCRVIWTRKVTGGVRELDDLNLTLYDPQIGERLDASTSTTTTWRRFGPIGGRVAALPGAPGSSARKSR